MVLPPPTCQLRHLGSPVIHLTLQEKRRRQEAGASGLPSPPSSRNGQFAPHVWIWSDLESGGNNTSQAGGQHTFDSLWGRGRRGAGAGGEQGGAGGEQACRLQSVLSASCWACLARPLRRSGSRSPAPPCTPGFLLLEALRLHVCPLLPLLSRRGHSSACPRPCPPLGFAWLSRKRAQGTCLSAKPCASVPPTWQVNEAQSCSHFSGPVASTGRAGAGPSDQGRAVVSVLRWGPSACRPEPQACALCVHSLLCGPRAPAGPLPQVEGLGAAPLLPPKRSPSLEPNHSGWFDLPSAAR